MRKASMAEWVGVGDAQTKRENIEVGQDGRGNAGDKQARRDSIATETQADGKRYGSMGDDGRHCRATGRSR